MDGNGYRRPELAGPAPGPKSTPCTNPIWQNAGHIRALRALVGEDVPLWSVIVFSGRCRWQRSAGDREDTAVCRIEELPRVLRKMGQSRALSRREVQDLHDRLEPYTRATWAEKWAHVRQVQEKERTQARARTQRCPWCGGALVVRTARGESMPGSNFMAVPTIPPAGISGMCELEKCSSSSFSPENMT